MDLFRFHHKTGTNRKTNAKKRDTQLRLYLHHLLKLTDQQFAHLETQSCDKSLYWVLMILLHNIELQYETQQKVLEVPAPELKKKEAYGIPHQADLKEQTA